MEKPSIPEDENRDETQIKELGARLKSIREAQGLKISDISKDTKIQKHYLSAIEEGNLDLLPKGPYVRSFVRQYCEYLSAKDLWKTYDTLTKERKIVAPISPEYEDKNYSDSPKVFKSRSFIWLYIIVIFSLSMAVWITWQYRGEISNISTTPIDGGTKEATRPQEIESEPVSTDSESPSVSAVPLSGDKPVDLAWMDGKPSSDSKTEPVSSVTKKEPVVRTRPIRVTAENANVWVKISQGNTIFFEGILKTGEFKDYEVGPNNPIRVRFGNPGKTSVLWDKLTISPVGTGKTPITKFFWPDGTTTDNDQLPN